MPWGIDAVEFGAVVAALITGAVAVVVDRNTGLVPNWLTIPTLAGALLVTAFSASWPAHVAGFGLAAVLGIPFFSAGRGGGGFTKLFLGFGLLLGWIGVLAMAAVSLGHAVLLRMKHPASESEPGSREGEVGPMTLTLGALIGGMIHLWCE